jgi:hypothetical protein
MKQPRMTQLLLSVAPDGILKGRTFDKWTVLSDHMINSCLACRCECGREDLVRRCDLLSGRSHGCNSCKKVTHGLSRSAEYKAWADMRKRCRDPRSMPTWDPAHRPTIRWTGRITKGTTSRQIAGGHRLKCSTPTPAGSKSCSRASRPSSGAATAACSASCPPAAARPRSRWRPRGWPSPAASASSFQAHTRVLVDQTSARFAAAGLDHGVIMAGREERDHPLQIGSIMTLVRRLDRVARFDLIVTDECHRATAESYGTILAAWPGPTTSA